MSIKVLCDRCGKKLTRREYDYGFESIFDIEVEKWLFRIYVEKKRKSTKSPHRRRIYRLRGGSNLCRKCANELLKKKFGKA